MLLKFAEECQHRGAHWETVSTVTIGRPDAPSPVPLAPQRAV